MASWPEIERLRKDVDGARLMAGGLLKFSRDVLSEWELEFLDNIQSHRLDDELSIRQAEKLFEVRDNVERISQYRGISIRIIVRRCYEARLDLSEDDEEWIAFLYANSPDSVRRKHVGRLMRCAHSLNLLD